MGIFSRKKINSEEYEDLSKKIISVTTDIELLNSKIAALKTNMGSLRSLVNRSFGDEEESEDIKSNVLLPE